MKNAVKGFLLGVLITILVVSSVAFASDASKLVEVLFNNVNIALNGEKIASIGDNYTLSNGEEVPFSMVYKGTTYLPLGKISEMLGKEVTWNGETSTVGINDTKNIVEGTIDELTDAYNLNIAWEEILKNPDDIISQIDMVQIVKNAYEKYYGTDQSKFLNELVESSDDIPTNRYQLAEIIYLAESERVFGYESIDKTKKEQMDKFLNNNHSGGVGKREDGTSGETGIWDFYDDFDELEKIKAIIPSLDYRFKIMNFVVTQFDIRTGKKLMKLSEEQGVRPNDPITNAEAIKTAVRYYYSFVPEGQFVEPEDIGRHNIDQALYTGDTNLPDATNEQLPMWKGILLFHQAWALDGALSCATDDLVKESDIKLLSDAGFNFARILTSFSRLQCDNRLDGCYYPMDGTVNVRQFEYWDKIISWGMKYGVHIQIVMNDIPGIDGSTVPTMEEMFRTNDKLFENEDLQESVAEVWGAISRRYDDIPNNYLSFNLMNEANPPNEVKYVNAFKPTIAAIRKECPDRLMIADIHTLNNVTGEKMAQQGVALSYHLYEPRDFCVPDMFAYNENPNIFDDVSWPYTDKTGKTLDAEACLNEKGGMRVSANELKAIADKHGVGFMIGEFGIFYAGEGGRIYEYSYPRDAVFHAMITDMVSIFAEKNIPSCYGMYLGECGLVSSMPVTRDITYEPIPNSNLFLDKETFNLWKELNQ